MPEIVQFQHNQKSNHEIMATKRESANRLFTFQITYEIERQCKDFYEKINNGWNTLHQNCNYLTFTTTKDGENYNIEGIVQFQTKKRSTGVPALLGKGIRAQKAKDIKSVGHYLDQKNSVLETMVYGQYETQGMSVSKGIIIKATQKQRHQVQVLSKESKRLFKEQLLSKSTSSSNIAKCLEIDLGGVHQTLNIAKACNIIQKNKMAKQEKARMKQFTLQHWQQYLRDEINNYRDDRKIIFIVDPEGKSGKSFFTDYMSTIYKDYCYSVTLGKKDSMVYQLMEDNPQLHKLRCIMVDIPRGVQEKHEGKDNKLFLNYSAIEELKNGKLSSHKYTTCNHRIRCPHIIVFSNIHVDYTQFSKDRMEIWIRRNNQYTKQKYTESGYHELSTSDPYE